MWAGERSRTRISGRNRMGTSRADAAAHGLEDEGEEEEFYGSEHLPPLLEDEENVSLADILSLRDSCLSEEEVLAVCVECVRSLHGIALSPLFHTLCITPDTLAFNAHGNVCFMEQLSDDPEGSFVPPEFDKTGSTLEGHIYSLGCTLSAALDFVIDPELEVDLGAETKRLLEQMQLECPEDRPHPQDIIALEDLRLTGGSLTICRKLSSIGRRVLSIESIAAFQDRWDTSWEDQWQPQVKASQLFGQYHSVSIETPSHSLDGYTNDWHPLLGRKQEEEELSLGKKCWTRASPWTELLENGLGTRDEEEEDVGFQGDSRSQNSSPAHHRSQDRQRVRARGFLNRSCSVPEYNNPPVALSPPPHPDISSHVDDLTEIGAEENPVTLPPCIWGKSFQRGSTLTNHSDQPCSETPSHTKASISETKGDVPKDNSAPETLMFSPNIESHHKMYSSNNHMTKSMMCLNEETQDEWISLKELLSHYNRSLTIKELWALCYICLTSLQTYTDFPAYLCLDSVFIGCEGDVLFLKPKNTGTCDSFYLAPEYLEHGIVTEKGCVYGVAAILWAAAKFNLSPNQKLAMPRKLKRLLLEMAKRTPIERPSIVMAKKSCRDYLSRQGTSVEAVWSQFIKRVRKPCFDRNGEKSSVSDDGGNLNEDVKAGFTPIASEGRLAPVSGPVPHCYPVPTATRLPEAYTSPSTHFTPIVLARDEAGTDKEPLTAGIPGNELSTHETVTWPNNHKAEDASLRGTPKDDVPACPAEVLEDRSGTSLSSSSSGRTLVNSPSLNNLMFEKLDPLAGKPTTIFNNFLLRQDPQTGHITLLPVQIASSVPINGLDLSSLPLTSNPADTPSSFNPQPEIQTRSSGAAAPSAYENMSLKICSNPNSPMPQTQTQVTQQMRPLQHHHQWDISPCPTSPQCSVLQRVSSLLRNQFAFNGCMESRAEDLGEYILSLKGLHFETFCRVIMEKFPKLCWEEDMLEELYCVVSCDLPSGESNDQASKAVERAAESPQRLERRMQWVEEADIHQPELPSAPEHSRTEGKMHENTPEAFGEAQEVIPVECHHANAGLGAVSACGFSVESPKAGEGVADKSPSEVEPSHPSQNWGEEEVNDAEGESGHLSQDSSTDMEDTDTLDSERTLSPSRTALLGRRYNPAWALALYGEDCFNQDVVRYTEKLGQHNSSPSLEEKTQELQQQLTIETRNLRKTRNFYHKLIFQEKKNKGSDAKMMLSKLKVQLEELKSKVLFLDSVRRYLEVLFVKQQGVEVGLLPSLVTDGTANPAVLNLLSEPRKGKCGLVGSSPVLAGTPMGLMSYLYARNAHLEGYIQQFLYTYRYFCTPEDFLHFLMDTFSRVSGENHDDPLSDASKVYHRTLELLRIWVEDCRLVDFTPKSNLLHTLNNFLCAEVAPVDSRGESLIALLQTTPRKRWRHRLGVRSGSPIGCLEDGDALSLQSFGRKSSIDDCGRKSFQWRISRVVEPQLSMPKEKMFSIAAALPRPCYSSLLTQLPPSCLRSEERLPFGQSQCSAQQAAQQLTLLEQEVFQGCHPVHFLNSRAQGIRDKSMSVSKCVSPESPALEGSGLFLSVTSLQDSPLQLLLQYADDVTNWVSAEVVICDSVKAQAGLISKFLSVAKYCYESRNFATAMQVLGGLENVIVRQLPAWKQLNAKVCEVLEELRAVQVFLKSDNLCLVESDHVRLRPTLPAAHILAMHLQQMEIGAFTLTSGAYKWPKLRSIAQVVSQVHAFQESEYPFAADPKLQAYLRLRITHLCSCDVALLAADNQANFPLTAERHAHRIQDTLRRVRATFQ
ncbi:kinase non-catalytic C-lobe domain-containing protein 1 isoform X2 [Denticeps clupeoides]|uniref:Kinase non-catalytic C-lobe domain-containing protein 1 n=1 Tax=Denticeps clupeoides TaxID=299321 RepID=A0AAY4EM50_9TELE|nr:kinase non-catalytic C-lobe domain-containing protein 1 isoform X2 [Denticeps clupeoides]